MRLSNLAIKYKHNTIKQLKESNTIKLTNAMRIERAETFLKLLHSNCYRANESKFVVLAEQSKEKRWSQWAFKTDEIDFNFLSSFLTFDNCYMSVNNFITTQRRNDTCFQMNALFVDLDYYKINKYANKTCEEMIEIMRKKQLFKKLEPSFFVDSGNGMYIYYLFQDTLNGQVESMRALYNSLEEKLIDKFRDFEADAQASDIARVVRVPGSINQKTKRLSKLIYNTDKRYSYNALEDVKRYTLKEITDILLDKKKSIKKQIQKREQHIKM